MKTTDGRPYFDKLLAAEIEQSTTFVITPTLGQILYGAPDPLLAEGSLFEKVSGGVYRRRTPGLEPGQLAKRPEGE